MGICICPWFGLVADAWHSSDVDVVVQLACWRRARAPQLFPPFCNFSPAMPLSLSVTDNLGQRGRLGNLPWRGVLPLTPVDNFFLATIVMDVDGDKARSDKKKRMASWLWRWETDGLRQRLIAWLLPDLWTRRCHWQWSGSELWRGSSCNLPAGLRFTLTQERRQWRDILLLIAFFFFDFQAADNGSWNQLRSFGVFFFFSLFIAKSKEWQMITGSFTWHWRRLWKCTRNVYRKEESEESWGSNEKKTPSVYPFSFTLPRSSLLFFHLTPILFQRNKNCIPHKAIIVNSLTTRILHHSPLQSVTGVWNWVKKKK